MRCHTATRRRLVAGTLSALVFVSSVHALAHGFAGALRGVFNHLIPLVEFVFETPLDRGQHGRTTGTINPGFLWSDRKFQLGIEAMIPVNRRTATGPGVIAQLHFYLDDIFSTTIGKPVFGR